MNIERADRKMREQEVGISTGPAKDELGVQVGVVRGLNCRSARMVLLFPKEPLGYPWVWRGLNCGLNGGSARMAALIFQGTAGCPWVFLMYQEPVGWSFDWKEA